MTRMVKAIDLTLDDSDDDSIIEVLESLPLAPPPPLHTDPNSAHEHFPETSRSSRDVKVKVKVKVKVEDDGHNYEPPRKKPRREAVLSHGLQNNSDNNMQGQSRNLGMITQSIRSLCPVSSDTQVAARRGDAVVPFVRSSNVEPQRDSSTDLQPLRQTSQSTFPMRSTIKAAPAGACGSSWAEPIELDKDDSSMSGSTDAPPLSNSSSALSVGISSSINRAVKFSRSPSPLPSCITSASDRSSRDPTPCTTSTHQPIEPVVSAGALTITGIPRKSSALRVATGSTCSGNSERLAEAARGQNACFTRNVDAPAVSDAQPSSAVERTSRESDGITSNLPHKSQGASAALSLQSTPLKPPPSASSGQPSSQPTSNKSLLHSQRASATPSLQSTQRKPPPAASMIGQQSSSSLTNSKPLRSQLASVEASSQPTTCPKKPPPAASSGQRSPEMTKYNTFVSAPAATKKAVAVVATKTVGSRKRAKPNKRKMSTPEPCQNCELADPNVVLPFPRNVASSSLLHQFFPRESTVDQYHHRVPSAPVRSTATAAQQSVPAHDESIFITINHQNLRADDSSLTSCSINALNFPTSQSKFIAGNETVQDDAKMPARPSKSLEPTISIREDYYVDSESTESESDDDEDDSEYEDGVFWKKKNKSRQHSSNRLRRKSASNVPRTVQHSFPTPRLEQNKNAPSITATDLGCLEQKETPAEKAAEPWNQDNVVAPAHIMASKVSQANDDSVDARLMTPRKSAPSTSAPLCGQFAKEELDCTGTVPQEQSHVGIATRLPDHATANDYYTLEEFEELIDKHDRVQPAKIRDIENGICKKANTRVEAHDSTAQRYGAQYGRILPVGVDTLLHKVLEVEPTDVFVDIGSGNGLIVLQAAFSTGCEARGVELVLDRHVAAENQVWPGLYGMKKASCEVRCKFRHGRLEDPAHREFLTDPSRVVKAVCNNFNGVFKNLKESVKELCPDDYVAGLFALMRPGSKLVTLDQLPMDIRPRSQVNEERRKMGLPPSDNASFYEMHEMILGKANVVASWSETAPCGRKGSNTKDIKIYVYTRLEQDYMDHDAPKAVFLCSESNCPHAKTSTPIHATIEKRFKKQVDRQESEARHVYEMRFVLNSCTECGRTRRTLRPRQTRNTDS